MFSNSGNNRNYQSNCDQSRQNIDHIAIYRLRFFILPRVRISRFRRYFRCRRCLFCCYHRRFFRLHLFGTASHIIIRSIIIGIIRIGQITYLYIFRYRNRTSRYLYFLKIIKPIIKHTDMILTHLSGICPHCHCDQCHAVSGRSADQCILRRFRHACLATKTSFIVFRCSLCHQCMMRGIRPTFRIHICRINRKALCTDNIQKILIFDCFPENQCHIVCRCIMILIRHSAGIYKVCIDTAKLLRFLVHHICKGSYRSGNLYSYLCCHIIC